MDKFHEFIELLKNSNIDFKIDSRKAKTLRFPVVRTKNAEKTIEILTKEKYSYEPSNASQSGQAFLVTKPEKFYVIVPKSKGGVEKKQLTPSNLKITEVDFKSKSDLLKIVTKSLDQTKLPTELKQICKMLLSIAAKEKKFDSKLLQSIDEQTMNNIRNDFGEVLCGMDSLSSRKAKSVFFPGKINEVFDYKENDTKMSVKGSKSSNVEVFGSGNSVSHIKEELEQYIKKTSVPKEKKIITALLLLAKKDLYGFLEYISNMTSTLGIIKNKKIIKKFDKSSLEDFVSRFDTNEDMYKYLPESKLGRSKQLNAKPTVNSILFWLLTNISADINTEFGKEINKIGQIAYSNRGSIRIFVLSKTEFVFQTKDYKDFKISFHYWGNEGSPLNNWPGLKVKKS